MNDLLLDDHDDASAPAAPVEHAPAELHAALALIADLADEATIEELEGVALACGSDLSTVLGLLQTPEGQRLANAARVKGVQSGELLQAKARRALNTGLDRIQMALRNRETSAATVGKLVEIANRLSGLAEERAARLKVAPDSGSTLTLNILTGDAPRPAPTDGLSLTIIAPDWKGGERPVRQAIDGEVVDG